MFKNIIVYRMTSDWQLLSSDVEAALVNHAQLPIGATQQLSHGFEPIHDGLFVNVVNRQLMLQFKTEKKAIPGSALKAAVSEQVAKIKDATGRKPGKKELRLIKEDALMAMLPSAIPSTIQTQVWIDPINGWIVINTGSPARADIVITHLIKALETLSLQTLHIARDPGSVMTEWLGEDGTPSVFTVDGACELKASDESRASVKYTNSNLDSTDLREHIARGKRCTKLALTWSDRISFVLTEQFRIKQIKFSDVVFTDMHAQKSADERESQDTDFVIMATELNALLSGLIEALGGEEPREAEAKTITAPAADDLF